MIRGAVVRHDAEYVSGEGLPVLLSSDWA
jgi:hypothetical protein